MRYSINEITLQQTVEKRPRSGSAKFLYGTGILLVSTVWASAGLFGLYILAFYAAALYNGQLAKWNQILPGLYNENAGAATTGIGLHFAMGGIILVLGSIQLISKIRDRWPAFHRWTGRVYITACIFAAIGGLTFIATKGTIGGPVMNTGFALYGVLMLLSAIEAWRHGAARRLDVHRAWAIRLYALAIGSWLYRMDYGFWLLLADGAGHLKNFRGPFDYTMAFFFYLPNLAVAEIFIRSRRKFFMPVVNVISAFALLLMTAFLILGTYYFTKFYWGPAILEWLM